VFVERKIVGRMKGRDHSEFSAILGYKALHESVDHYGKEHPFTVLCPKLTGEDPDDAFSRVPYGRAKGFINVDSLDVSIRKTWHRLTKISHDPLMTGMQRRGSTSCITLKST